MMFVILGLAFLNMFAIGLASHTMKFDIHYKNNVFNTIVFVALLVIIACGSLILVLTNFPIMQVSPESTWNKHDIQIPTLSHGSKFVEPTLDPNQLLQSDVEFNESEWYPLVNKLQVGESCEGIENAAEVCNALDYKITVEANSGSLRISLPTEETLSLQISENTQ